MNQIKITSGMKYGEAKTLLAALWPRIRVIIYRSTVQHYKEGYPTAEELELGDDEEMCRTPGREAVLHGEMTGQDLHHAVMKTFSLDTELGVGIHGMWRKKLSEA